MISWTPQNCKLFREALIETYRDYDSLKIFVRDSLGERLENICSQKSNQNTLVFELIEWTQSKKNTAKLFYAFCDENPHREIIFLGKEGIVRETRSDQENSTENSEKSFLTHLINPPFYKYFLSAINFSGAQERLKSSKFLVLAVACSIALAATKFEKKTRVEDSGMEEHVGHLELVPIRASQLDSGKQIVVSRESSDEALELNSIWDNCQVLIKQCSKSDVVITQLDSHFYTLGASGEGTSNESPAWKIEAKRDALLKIASTSTHLCKDIEIARQSFIDGEIKSLSFYDTDKTLELTFNLECIEHIK
jgi:hypothetical protein